jgi:putative FmdB family regulatory protein
MPLYEYRCQGCGERFEVLQRMGASADEVLCPSCGAEHPERLLSTFAASFGHAGGGGGGETTPQMGGGGSCGPGCGCH